MYLSLDLTLGCLLFSEAEITPIEPDPDNAGEGSEMIAFLQGLPGRQY